mgnify:CR=1 FL=1
MRHTIMKLCWNKPFFNISPRSKKENTTYYLFQMSWCKNINKLGFELMYANNKLFLKL